MISQLKKIKISSTTIDVIYFLFMFFYIAGSFFALGCMYGSKYIR